MSRPLENLAHAPITRTTLCAAHSSRSSHRSYNRALFNVVCPPHEENTRTRKESRWNVTSTAAIHRTMARVLWPAPKTVRCLVRCLLFPLCRQVTPRRRPSSVRLFRDRSGSRGSAYAPFFSSNPAEFYRQPHTLHLNESGSSLYNRAHDYYRWPSVGRAWA